MTFKKYLYRQNNVELQVTSKSFYYSLLVRDGNLLSTPALLLSGAFLVVICILLALYLRALSSCASLTASLEEARLRRQSDERELTQRSELDGIKDEFVSTVSHELRTPLTSIRGALGLLNSGVLGTVDTQAQNLLRIALTNTERLIRLINDILDLQRMDSGLSVLQVRRCSLTDLVQQAMETMNAMADAAEVKLTVSPAAKLVLPSIFFDGDSDRILQVLTNLLSNAIKFSPSLSTVTIEVETPPDTLIFKISDQGRGIPEEQLETVFDRFKQVEPGDARQRGGTGLGLAICRSIIQQHGGSIWAQRNPVKGSSVCVKLPRSQRTYDTTVQEQASITLLIDSQPRRSADSVVLVCDDDEAHRAFTAAQLRSHGHAVLEAASSDEAIDIAQRRPSQHPLQAILLDLHMSDMKGWKLLGSLISNAATSSVPIVVLSVQRSPDSPRSGKVVQEEEDLFVDLSHAIGVGHGSSQILLVEDDENLARAVVGGFAGTGVNVVHGASLDRAMACCRDRRPDLMILNLALADGDGFAMIEWLRIRPELRSVPLIVYSGKELSAEERSRINSVPTRFLTSATVHTRDFEQLVLSMVHKGQPHG